MKRLRRMKHTLYLRRAAGFEFNEGQEMYFVEPYED